MSSWNPPPRGWQHELLEKLPPGVDSTQIVENLKRTPSERLERMLSFRRGLDEMRQAVVERHRHSD